jgi:hypothetical protein
MEKKIFLFALAIATCAVFALGDLRAQTPPPAPAQTAPPAQASEKPLADTLGWLIGSWEGEGASKGGSQFIGKLDVTAELDETALLVSRESMNKEGGPSGGKKELFLIGYDGTTKKLIGTLYDNKNRIALFAGEVAGEDVVFNLAIPAPQAGYVNRITFRHLADGGVAYFVEEATPGKEVSKVVEINFKKKA